MKPVKSESTSIDSLLFEIDDYIGGNFEVDDHGTGAHVSYDAMALTVFLRGKLHQAYQLGRESMREGAVDNLPVTGLNHEICSDCQSIAIDAIKSLKP